MKRSTILALGFTLIVSTASFISTAVFPDDPEPESYRVAPIRRPPQHEARKNAAAAQAEAIESGRFVVAPEEPAIKPTLHRAVMLSNFAGMTFNDTLGFVPPDTHAVTGPNHIVETVNTTVAFFDRSSGAKLFQQHLEGASGFFADLGASENLTDPNIAYDEIHQRFIIGVLDFGANNDQSRLLYAVSDTSNPQDGFTEKHSIDMAEPAQHCPAGTVFADFPRVGWNADVYVFTFNMFNAAGTCVDHVSIITIAKSLALDSNNSTIPVFSHADFDDTHFTITPAAMHGGGASGPMWLVEEAGFVSGSEMRVIKMTDVLNSPPIFSATDITVAGYGFPPSASQRGGGRIDTGDSRILNVEWRNDRLIATHVVGISGTARARWYEFDTSDTLPILTQQGTINQGSGVHTYFPSIAIAPNGDLGMTFMQSSSNKFMSMYVTGRLPDDPPGTMQKPVLAKAGVTNYRDFDCFDGGHFIHPCRAGDFSGITVDPDANDTFCAANEYAISRTISPDANWGTWITCFRIGVHDLAVTSITAPGTVTGPGPVPSPVKVTIQNRSDHKETVTSSDLGDGTTSGLIRLSVTKIDIDETCSDALVILDPANAALFTAGPKVLASKAKLTVGFLVTYDCSNPATKTTSSAGDYSHTATVHHVVLDGNADSHAPDDVCPHDRLPGGHDPNPLSKGTMDNGCGAKKTKTTLGNPVVTNVVAP